jgi:hypothetical protein
MKTNFIPYTNVSMARLQEIAFNISQLSQYDLREAIVEFLRRDFGFKFSKQRMFKFDIVPTSINGVKNAAIIVKYPKSPILYTEESVFEEKAIAVPVKMKGNKTIPVIFLFSPEISMRELNHEKIHICQQLLESHYPFSEEEFALSISDKGTEQTYYYIRRSIGEEEAKRYIINFICYRFWLESEAIFHAEVKDLNSWLFRVLTCFNPFDYLVDYKKGFHWDEDSWITAVERFSQFCHEMQTQVCWISQMLGGRSLIEELYYAYERMTIELVSEREQMNLFHDNGGSNDTYLVKTDSKKIGRNEPCHCGSGKKHKKCCLNKDA